MGAALIYSSPAAAFAHDTHTLCPRVPLFPPQQTRAQLQLLPTTLRAAAMGQGTAQESWAVTSKDLEMPLSRGGPIQEAGDKSEGTGSMKDRKQG